MKKCKFTSVAKIRYLLTALLILTGVTSVYGAEFLPEKNCFLPKITILGELKAGDSQRLERAFSGIADYSRNSTECRKSGEKIWRINVWLHSNGGDVDVALDMGRIIRREKGHAIVPANSKCFSSCVFLLAAGIRRISYGDIGIHRPYFSALSHAEDVSVVRAKREAINKRIRAYFDEMDTPQGLLDLMLSIPPGEIKILTETELVSFRLNGVDPTHDEMETAKSAYQWNTTSAEYRRRSARSDAICPKISIMDDESHEARGRRTLCMYSILLNITEQEYNKRVDKFNAVCKSNNREEKLQCLRDIVTLGK